MIPRDGRGERGDRTKVYRDIAISHSDTTVVYANWTATLAGTGAVGVGFSPEVRAASESIVELEADVVVAITSNDATACFQTSLEVQVIAGGGIRAWHTRAPAREEKQGEEEQGERENDKTPLGNRPEGVSEKRLRCTF